MAAVVLRDEKSEVDERLLPLVMEGLHAARTGHYANGLPEDEQRAIQVVATRSVEMALLALDRGQIDATEKLGEMIVEMMAAMAGAKMRG
ncbi:MAG TPA: hypothetical protein ENK43_04375 [Planctomycetes bacterium]|nr:hypothetical protein [Planctomycetota bacterium]